MNDNVVDNIEMARRRHEKEDVTTLGGRLRKAEDRPEGREHGPGEQQTPEREPQSEGKDVHSASGRRRR